MLGDFDRISDTLCQAGKSGRDRARDAGLRGPRTATLHVARHVRSTQARVWDWRGINVWIRTTWQGLRFPVEASGIFELVAGSDWYRGAIPQRPSQVKFYQDLNVCRFRPRP